MYSPFWQSWVRTVREIQHNRRTPLCIWLSRIEDAPGKAFSVIHNSARYPDLDKCSVEVHFREIIDLVRSFACTQHFILPTPPARTRRVSCSSKLFAHRGSRSDQIQYFKVHAQFTLFYLYRGPSTPTRTSRGYDGSGEDEWVL